MAGLLTQTTNDQAAPQQGDAAPTAANIEDPILKQIEQGIEQSVPPEMQDTFQAAMVSGMTIMFSKETSNLMTDQLNASGDIVKNVSEGIAGLIVMIYNEGKLTEQQIPALAMAAVPLMCQALDYAEKANGIDVTPELAAQCTKATTAAVMQKFGISQDQVDQVIATGQQQGGAQQQQMAGV